MKDKPLRIPFVKMNGAGNDFVLIDNRSKRFVLHWSKVARTVCERRFGIGADGLLVLERSTKHDFKMLYFNADGSSGGMCGNGGRCVSAYVMDERKNDRVLFDAVGYTYSARKVKNDIWLTMKDPKIIFFNEYIKVLNNKTLATFINTGAPHVIIFQDDLPSPFKDEVIYKGVNILGKVIRYHKQFSPHGTNVDFLKVTKQGIVSMRTYERGVENETLACGTGAVASAITCSVLSNLKSPIKVQTRGGKTLTVRFQRNGNSFSEVVLCGPVQYSFKGEFILD